MTQVPTVFLKKGIRFEILGPRESDRLPTADCRDDGVIEV